MEPASAPRRKVLRRERGAVASAAGSPGSDLAESPSAVPQGSVRAPRRGRGRCGLRRGRRPSWERQRGARRGPGGMACVSRAAGEDGCPGRGAPARPPSAAGRASPCDSARQRPVCGLSIPALSLQAGHGPALGALWLRGRASGVRTLANCRCSQRTKTQSARIAHQRRPAARAHLPEFPAGITEKRGSCSVAVRNRCREKLGIHSFSIRGP